MRDREVALPAGVAGVRLRQTLSDRERGLVAGQRRRQVALRLLHVADLVVRDREVALPAGVAGVRLRQTLADRERGLVAGQRRRQVALRLLHVADLAVRDREVALPAGVAGVRLRQTLNDRERGLVAGQRRRQVALRLLHVADLVVRDRQVALPAGVAGVRLRQTLGDRQRAIVIYAGAGQVAKGLPLVSGQKEIIGLLPRCALGKLVGSPFVETGRLGVVKLNCRIVAPSSTKLCGLAAMFVDGSGLLCLGLLKQSVCFIETAGLASFLRLAGKIGRRRILRRKIGEPILHLHILCSDFRHLGGDLVQRQIRLTG